MKDSDGKAFWVEFVNVAKAQKSGFVEYRWPKPGSDQPLSKLSHVALFEPWGWVVGTGVYVDDLDEKFWQSARSTLLIAGLGGLFTIVSALSIIRSVTLPISRLRAAMIRIADEDFAAHVPDVVRGDMARSLVALRDSINERVQGRVAAAEEQRALIEYERGACRKVFRRAQSCRNGLHFHALLTF